MNKAEKIWTEDAEKMKSFLLQELKETGTAWKTLIEQSLENGQRGKFLDVGCGTGFLSFLLASIGGEVIAIDNNVAMLEEAEKTSEGFGFSDKIIFMHKDAEVTEFDENTFDAVVSRNAFWLFRRPKKVYREWFRILRPGGVFLNFDANWMFPFWGEKEAKLFQSDEDALIKQYGAFQDYYHNADMMEEFKKLPLSDMKRPEWDLKVCGEMGFRNITAEILAQERYWNPFLALRYRHMPTFFVRAKK